MYDMKCHNKRRLYIILLICCAMALTFALIPVNIFCVNFPEWVTVLLSLFSCCGLIAYLAAFKTKAVIKIVLLPVFGLTAIVCSFAPYLIPYWNSFSFKNYNGVVLNYNEVIPYEDAADDLNALMGHLKKVHPLFGDGVTADVKTAYLQALKRLETADTITVNDLRREIQTVLYPMHDAHTSTYNNYPDDRFLKVFPQKNHEGYSVFSINGKCVEQLFEDAKPYVCYETEDWISIDLGSLATLDFYGYDAPFVFEWTDGDNVISEVYSEKDFVSWEEFLEIRAPYVEGGDKPTEFVYYEIDREKSLALLTLTQCDYNQTYVNCVRSMFEEIMQKDIHNVAVDLRGNGGGSSLVGNEFIKYLPVDMYYDGPYDWRWGFLNFHSDGQTANKQYKDLLFNGNVYMLTDRDSFSAAKDFAMLIQDNRLGKVIGASPANTVNGYGEIAVFHLPNTGLYVQISTKKWYRIDQTNTDSYVMPDYTCNGQNAIEKLYEILEFNSV